jgi:hypothetical protein
MSKPDVISYNNRPIAIILRHDIDVDGIRFFTEPENAFQVGLHHRSKGLVLPPHIHKIQKSITVKEIQEVLLILSGSIRLTLYSRDGNVLGKRILKTNDGVLLMREGHKIEYLEETRMFEVKQGPYPGSKNAKIYLVNKPAI